MTYAIEMCKRAEMNCKINSKGSTDKEDTWNAKTTVRDNRNIIKIGTWNTRGTNKAGKLLNLNYVAKNYTIDMPVQELKQKNTIMEIQDYIMMGDARQQKILMVVFLIHTRKVSLRNLKYYRIECVV